MYDRTQFELVDPCPFDAGLNRFAETPEGGEGEETHRRAKRWRGKGAEEKGEKEERGGNRVGASGLVLRQQFFTNEVAYGIAAKRMVKTPALRFLYRCCVEEGYGRRGSAETRMGAELTNGEEETKMEETYTTQSGTKNVAKIAEEPLALPSGITSLAEAAMAFTPLLFISDIRSGSLECSNFEEHVRDNMAAQRHWHRIMRPEYSLLKFRLPYMEYDITGTEKVMRHTEQSTSYLDGDLLLPVWTRATSTECRLVTKGYASDRAYDNKHFEDSCFYFNTVLRSQVYFARNKLLRHEDLDHRFDASAELQLLVAYALCKESFREGGDERLRQPNEESGHVGGEEKPWWKHVGEARLCALLHRKDLKLTEALLNSVTNLSSRITQHLGRSFDEVIASRNSLMRSRARNRDWMSEMEESLKSARQERNKPLWSDFLSIRSLETDGCSPWDLWSIVATRLRKDTYDIRKCEKVAY